MEKNEHKIRGHLRNRSHLKNEREGARLTGAGLRKTATMH